MKRLDTILIGVVILLLAVNLFFTITKGSQEGTKEKMSREDRLRLANEFFNNELYIEAIEIYEDLLTDKSFSENKRANMLFTIAETYKNNLKMYDKALATYIRLSSLFPDTELMDDAERGKIECLDNLGRKAQAQSRLEKVVTLGDEAEDVPPTQIIAKIGDRAITIVDLNRWLNKMPDELARKYRTPEKKYELLKAKIADQLLYDAALRSGYDRRPELEEAIADAKRQILASAYYRDHVTESFSASEEELSAFYEQYKEEYFGGKAMEEVSDSVVTMFKEYKLMDARYGLSRSLYEAEKVQLFPQNLGVED